MKRFSIALAMLLIVASAHAGKDYRRIPKTIGIVNSSGDETGVVDTPFYVRDSHIPLSATNYLSVHLTNGAAVNMAVNGSVTTVTNSYVVPAGFSVDLRRCFVVIEDGNTAFTPGNFGGLGPLTNGVLVGVIKAGESLVELEVWKTNRELRDTMFDFDQSFKSDGVYTGRWTFTKDIDGNGFVLNAGDQFVMVVRDNLTSLEYLSLRLKGDIETP